MAGADAAVAALRSGCAAARASYAATGDDAEVEGGAPPDKGRGCTGAGLDTPAPVGACGGVFTLVVSSGGVAGFLAETAC